MQQMFVIALNRKSKYTLKTELIIFFNQVLVCELFFTMLHKRI